jgi:hypothetical protein
MSIIKYTDEEGMPQDERDQYTVMVMSHEKKGERDVLNRQYEIPFVECQFKKEDGVPQWRTLLRVDRRQRHPFHIDERMSDEECEREKVPMGSYRLGRPNFFDVVEDGQENVPRNDAGLATHRAQLFEWKRRKIILTSTGIQDAIPMKYHDDTIDATRMILAEEYLSATPLTKQQRDRNSLRERLRAEDLTIPLGSADYNGILMARQMAIRDIERQNEREIEQIASVVRGVIRPPSRCRR